MSKRTTPGTPEVDPGERPHFPGLRIRKDKLESAIANLQSQAYDNQINLVVAESGVSNEVAVPIGEGRAKMVQKDAHLREIKDNIQNAARGIKALQVQLDALPVEEEVEDEPDITPPEETS